VCVMITEIDREELWQKLNHPKKSVLLEALPVDEYRQSHLPGALNLPPEEVPKLASELIPRKDIEVIVYCASAECDASEKVATELIKMGFSNVRRYVGGKRNWIEAGLPTVVDKAAA
jgi:rhodanese-related sulfurtransferase